MNIHKKSQRSIKIADQIADQNTNTIKFTHLTIKHLKPQAKRKIFWCDGMMGFGLRVTPKGIKTWIFQFRIDGKERRMTLGKFPRTSLSNAISLYSDALSKVEIGIDPLSERNKKIKMEEEELTLYELIDIYMGYCKESGKITYKSEERAFEKDLPASIKRKKISEIQSKEIATIVQKIIAKGTPGTAEHIFKYTRRLFNFAADIGLLKRRDNPCLDIKLNLPKKKRERHLNSKEIYLYWNNINDVPMACVTRLALKFLLCTVARSIEVRTMKWSDVDLHERIWTQPTSKNGRMHRVHLGDLALSILEEVSLYTGASDLVFGSTRHFRTCGKKKTEDLEIMKSWSLSQPFRRHFPKLGIEEKFYPHDLRRTGATLIAGLFGRRDLATMALNHTTSDVTGIYDLYAYDREKKMALVALNKAIELIVNSSNVESIPTFDELRAKVSQPVQLPNPYEGQGVDNQQGFQASFSSPVSYTLSVCHDGSKNVA